MDRALDAGFVLRRRVRQWLRLGGVVVVAALALAFARQRLAASVRRADLRTAVVDRGPVASTLEASGLVLPERESVLVSPADTRVIAARKTPGDLVSPGDVVLELDSTAARLELERLERQVALKANAREQARLECQRALADLAADESTRELELGAHQQRAARDRKLAELGLAAADVVRESSDMVARDGIGLRRVQARRDEMRRELAVRIEALDLEHAILGKERDEARRMLDESAVKARENGVVTWLVATAGASVRKGEEVARIAELSAFKVEATLADVHASVIHVGLAAVVQAPGALLKGTVSHVRPTVEDGTLRLEVALDEPASPALRHKLRVDVHVVTTRRDSTLRVGAAPFLQPDGSDAAWVVRGDRARKVPVRLGIRGLDQVEVLDGLAPGDEIVLSDMSDYARLMEVRIR